MPMGITLICTACNFAKKKAECVSPVMKHWSDINLVSLLLWPLSLLFRCLAACRRQLYRSGLLKTWQAPVPVIIVGNISVGGTGKTPVVIALVDWLKAQGYKPGVISRGYGGQKHSVPTLLDAQSEPSDVGDEPVLIARRTGAPVCVFPLRIESAKALLNANDCDVLIADDGLQHYALERDLEIIVVDAQKLHGNGFCLPAGPLREPVSRIGKQAYTLYNRTQASDDGNSFTLVPGDLVALDNSQKKSASSLAGIEVLACAGTASPERFFKTLSSFGIRLNTRVFPDHHPYTAGDFENPAGLPIVMTEKDAVKCTNFGLKNAWYLPVETTLPEPLKKRVLTMLSHVSRHH